MIGSLVVLALLQAATPRVSASVSDTEVLLGDAIVLTIRVEAAGSAPVRIVDPVLSGFDMQGSREATHVRIIDGVPARTVTRELRLVATQPGSAAIGPVRVRQGEAVAETASISVTVRPASASTAEVLPAAVRRALERTAAPSGSTAVVVHLIAIPDDVRVGDQLDLLTIAWFRRDVRRQLRTPPTLAPPAVEGVWSYRQTAPSGIVTSRRAGDQWYDLFVGHQVVFPLTPGPVRVGRATVTYALPLTYSFLSRELQHEVTSDSLTVAVRPPPLADRPADFSGAAGADLTLDVTASTRELRDGAAATLTVTLRGTGNVALWPEPRIEWPVGLRVYPGEVSVEVDHRDGRVGGTKRFTWLVAADSAGTHRVAPPVFTYFDTDRERYERLTAPALEFVAPTGTAVHAPRTAPPPLREADDPALARRLFDLSVVVWVNFLALPPLLFLTIRVAAPALERRRGRQGSDRDPVPAGGEAARLERAFRTTLGQVVPDAEHREGRALADALRAAGVDATLAVHAVRARERLRAVVFAPGAHTDSAELEAEVEEILRALEGAFHGGRRRGTTFAALLMACSVSSAVGQGPSPEQLYAAGAYSPAAAGFLARAAEAPAVAAAWYNAGNAFYRTGEDGRALAAWLTAARLEPRAPDIRRALALVPRDPVTAALVPVYPITPAELALLAAVTWMAGWLLLLGRRTRPGVVLLGAALLAGGLALGVRRVYARPVAITLGVEVPLRAAPYGPAPAERHLARGAGVRVERVGDGWLLVERNGARGWVRPGEVARL